MRWPNVFAAQEANASESVGVNVLSFGELTNRCSLAQSTQSIRTISKSVRSDHAAIQGSKSLTFAVSIN